MALTKLTFKPGINKEVTAYAAKGTWVDCDKVRFRSGFPEKIGGWLQVTAQTFLGVCRALIEWATLGGTQLMGVGTHLKYYIAFGGVYFDITPIRVTTAAGDVTFAAVNGSAVVTVTDVAHGAMVNDYVTFSGAVSLGGNITAAVLNAEYQITAVLTANTYTITATATANASDTGNGGAAVVGAYQIHVGLPADQAVSGWGAGSWGAGAWGIGEASVASTRFWNHANYGEDLIYGPRGGALYYWDFTTGTGVRGIAVTGSDVPVVHTALLISDVSRFVMAFGCNELGDTALDPMLVRWSAQEDYTNWTPAVTNQAGGIRLSRGSYIVTAVQSRQEILVWTDTALYAMQYVGPDTVWSPQLMGDNLSIAAPNAVAVAGETVFWMGSDKFYRYNGRTMPMPCPVRDYIFSNINTAQRGLVCCGTNETYNEVWWHYPTATSEENDAYVIYNYVDDTWAVGTLGRTAWLDSAFQGRPIAAVSQVLVAHELGADDGTADTPVPIEAYVESADVDIGDGDRFAFIWRMLPDISFAGSTVPNPQVTLELRPKTSSGAGYKAPASVGGTATQPAVRTATVPVESYTEQVNIRVRGRQLSLRIDSDSLGVQWQLGTPRVDIRTDGQRA